MNFLKDHVIDEMISQSLSYNNLTYAYGISNEIHELNKKYSDVIIGYRGQAFQISSFLAKSNETPVLTADDIIVLGHEYIPGTGWKVLKVPLSDPDLDLSFYYNRLLNTKLGVVHLRRKVEKQWKWGLNNNNTLLKPLFINNIHSFPEGANPRSLASRYILESLFNNIYPNIEEILSNPKGFNINNGVAVNKDLAVVVQKFSKGEKPMMFLYYKPSFKEPIARVMRKSGRVTWLNSDYEYLTETVQELGFKV